MADEIIEAQGDKTKIELRREWASAALEQLSELPCIDEAQDAWWASKLAQVQAAWNEHEADRTELTKPVNDALRKINAAFKPDGEKLEALKGLIKSKRAGYAVALHKAQEAARLAAVSAAQAGDAQGCNDALAAIPEASANKGVKVVWRWRVKDLSKVELMWRWVATEKLDLHAKSAGETEPAPVAGIEFYPDATVRATRAK